MGGSLRNASRWVVHFVLLSPTILQKAPAIKNTLSVMMANQAPGEDGTPSPADPVRAQPRGLEAGEEASAGEDRCPGASYTGGGRCDAGEVSTWHTQISLVTYTQ